MYTAVFAKQQERYKQVTANPQSMQKDMKLAMSPHYFQKHTRCLIYSFRALKKPEGRQRFEKARQPVARAHREAER